MRTSTPSGSAVPAPFEREFAELVEQAAPWAALEIKVTRARLFRGAKPAELGAGVQFSESKVYAVLDINITAIGNTETNYSQRDSWDLILGDGTRLRPVNALGVVLVRGDSPTARLYYPADENMVFTGAALEVNGADRVTYEPLRIPLDVEQSFERALQLPNLVGPVSAAMAEGEVGYEILQAVYGPDVVQLASRAERDRRLLMIETRVSDPGFFDVSFSSGADGPTVSVNGREQRSVVDDLETIPGRGSLDFVSLYQIDATARSFDIVFDPGTQVVIRVPVVLPPP